MAYEIYITDAFVCSARANNTSDKSYLLLTREAGMLWASAKSVREERSKHRYALQEFSLARVSLVRGKGGWRITGAEATANLYWSSDSREERAVLRNIVRLLHRCMQGETPAPHLYDDIVEALSKRGVLSPRLETLLSLRILSTLGYVAPDAENRVLIDAESTLVALGEVTDAHEVSSKKSIARALEASHL